MPGRKPYGQELLYSEAGGNVSVRIPLRQGVSWAAAEMNSVVNGGRQIKPHDVRARMAGGDVVLLTFADEDESVGASAFAWVSMAEGGRKGSRLATVEPRIRPTGEVKAGRQLDTPSRVGIVTIHAATSVAVGEGATGLTINAPSEHQPFYRGLGFVAATAPDVPGIPDMPHGAMDYVPWSDYDATQALRVIEGNFPWTTQRG